MDCLTSYDWSRSYVLPADVRGNIPLRGQRWHARRPQRRGFLVETCRHTGAYPAGLHYVEFVLVGSAIFVVDATVLALMPTGELLTVHARTRHRRHGDAQDGDWSPSVDGGIRPDKERRRRPSPPMQGRLVHRLVRRPTSG